MGTNDCYIAEMSVTERERRLELGDAMPVSPEREALLEQRALGQAELQAQFELSLDGIPPCLAGHTDGVKSVG